MRLIFEARHFDVVALDHKERSRLDPSVTRRIKAFLRDRVAALEDPRTVGPPASKTTDS